MKTSNLLKRFQGLGIALLALLIFSACSGKKEGTTPVSIGFKLGAIVDVSAGAGGVLLYGKSNLGNFAKYITPGAADATLTLPNGTWDFYVLAWAGPSAFDGTVRCAKTSAVLNGEASSVSLVLNNGNCNDTVFAVDGAYFNGSSYEFSTSVDMGTCRDISVINANDGTNMQKCKRITSNIGHAWSFKVVMSEYSHVQGITVAGSEIVSDCVVQNPAPTTSFSNAYMTGHIPSGSPGSPFETKVRAYYGSTDCGVTEDVGYKEYVFPSGLNESKADAISYTTNTAIRLFLQTTDLETCSGERISNAPYAGGLGTTDFPNIICTTAQWNAIQGDYGTGAESESFLLASNLDFAFGTFNLLGHTSASTSEANPYSGSFFGNNHRISNVNYEVNEIDDVGLIRAMGSGSVVENLTLDPAIFKCSQISSLCQNVGGITGRTSGTTVTINNVRLNVDIEGEGNTGGVVGQNTASTLSITQAHAVVDIRGQAANGGGIVGNLGSTGTISESSASGNVRALEYSASDANAGGIVGLNQGGTISKVSFRGRVSGYRSVGGLVGQMTTGTLADAYSQAVVTAKNNSGADASVGGAIGWLSGGTVSRVLVPDGAQLSAPYSTVPATGIGENMAYTGGLVGKKTGGTCNNVFFRGHDNSTGTFGLTPISAQGATCGTYLANWTDGHNSSTYNTPWSGGFYANGGCTTEAWCHVDDAYDFPWLSHELVLVADVPYLYRPCSGNFASTIGTGALADPQWVCTLTQFNNMVAGTNYILKRDFDINQASPLTSFFKAAGVYKIDGDDHNIYLPSFDLATPGNSIAFFEGISAGGYLEDLHFYNGRIDISAGPSPGGINALTQAAIVAVSNAGILSNVTSEGSIITSFQQYVDNAGSLILAGLVVNNTGDIDLVKNTGQVLLKTIGTGAGTGNGPIKMAGLAYQNSGTISAVDNDMIMTLSGGGSGDETLANHYISGVVINNLSGGILSEISSSGHISMTGSAGWTGAGTMAGLVGYDNQGTIQYSKIGSSFFSNEFNGTLAGLVNLNNGTMTQVIYHPGGGPGNQFNSSNVPLTTAGISVGGSGTTSDVFCIDPTQYSISGTFTSSANNNVTFPTNASLEAKASIFTQNDVCISFDAGATLECGKQTSVSTGTITVGSAPWTNGSPNYIQAGLGMSGCSESATYSFAAGVFGIDSTTTEVTAPETISTTWDMVDSGGPNSGTYRWFFESTTQAPHLNVLDWLYGHENGYPTAYFP